MNWRTIIGLAAATSLGLAPFSAATAQTAADAQPPQSRPQRPFVAQTPPPPLPVVTAAKSATPPAANTPSAKAGQKPDTNKKI
jgi:hypothetical protein